MWAGTQRHGDAAAELAGAAPGTPGPATAGAPGAAPSPAAASATSGALSVTEFSAAIAALLSNEVGVVRVFGEISGLSRPASGHWYFNLKDKSASVRAVMFRMHNRRAAFQPVEGQQVIVCATATLYEARGDFQLVVETVEAAGDGDLHARFIALRDRLQAEGLFDAGSRRPLPARVRHIGIVTSLNAAALQDVLSTLQARDASVPVTVYPTLVQGAAAVETLLSAITAAQAHGRADVLLLVRGGGSIDDLWCFNDERLARAIRACRIPVVVGVGHETDFTIADFAADLRALTPTAAAVAVTSDRQSRRQRVDRSGVALHAAVMRHLGGLGQRVDHASARLPSPRQWLAAQTTALATLEAALRREAIRRAELSQMRLLPATGRLRAGPAAAMEARLARAEKALGVSVSRRAATLRHRLERAGEALVLVDPKAVLRRGYALVRGPSGAVLGTVDAVEIGQDLRITLSDGSFGARVTDAGVPDADQAAHR